VQVQAGPSRACSEAGGKQPAKTCPAMNLYFTSKQPQQSCLPHNPPPPTHCCREAAAMLSFSGDGCPALVLEASTVCTGQATMEERRRDRPRDMARWRSAVPGVGAAAARACATSRCCRLPSCAGCGVPRTAAVAGSSAPRALAAGGVSTASSKASTCNKQGGGAQSGTREVVMPVAPIVVRKQQQRAT
jgi:hypothetical protein